MVYFDWAPSPVLVIISSLKPCFRRGITLVVAMFRLISQTFFWSRFGLTMTSHFNLLDFQKVGVSDLLVCELIAFLDTLITALHFSDYHTLSCKEQDFEDTGHAAEVHRNSELTAN